MGKRDSKQKWIQPIGNLIGVGRNSGSKIRKIGINTNGDLAHYDKDIFDKEIWGHGKEIHESAILA